jgi:hypothetical protein
MAPPDVMAITKGAVKQFVEAREAKQQAYGLVTCTGWRSGPRG